MSAKKKPTMKQMEKVTNNIIHDLGILNQKIEASLFGLRCFIDFMDKREDFNKYMKEVQEKQKRENDERTESIKATSKADSK